MILLLDQFIMNKLFKIIKYNYAIKDPIFNKAKMLHTQIKIINVKYVIKDKYVKEGIDLCKIKKDIGV